MRRTFGHPRRVAREVDRRGATRRDRRLRARAGAARAPVERADRGSKQTARRAVRAGPRGPNPPAVGPRAFAGGRRPDEPLPPTRRRAPRFPDEAVGPRAAARSRAVAAVAARSEALCPRPTFTPRAPVRRSVASALGRDGGARARAPRAVRRSARRARRSRSPHDARGRPARRGGAERPDRWFEAVEGEAPRRSWVTPRSTPMRFPPPARRRARSPSPPILASPSSGRGRLPYCARAAARRLHPKTRRRPTAFARPARSAQRRRAARRGCEPRSAPPAPVCSRSTLGSRPRHDSWVWGGPALRIEGPRRGSRA